MVIARNPRERKKLEMAEVTDPAELERVKRCRADFDRNLAWHQAHLKEIYREDNRGKFFCIAGGELFVADTMETAVAKAWASHPDDGGRFTHRVADDFDQPSRKIYAIQR